MNLIKVALVLTVICTFMMNITDAMVNKTSTRTSKIVISNDKTHLDVPYKLIWEWKQQYRNPPFLHLVNESIPNACIHVSDPTDRVRKRLETAFYRINLKLLAIRGGRQREEMFCKSYRLELDIGELSNAQESADASDTCDKLQQDLQKATKELDKVTKQNQELHEYISDKLALVFPAKQYAKKPLEELGGRQRSRRIKQVEQNIRSELWFTKALGIEIDYVKARDNTGQSFKLCCNNEASQYNNLNDADKQKVQSILSVMDRYSIGDCAYHEITMMEDELPRSYLIKQCRSSLNQMFHISRTPGVPQGVQLSFIDEVSKILKSEHPEFFATSTELHRKVRVKISGDGAQMSRNTTFTTVSFALLSGENKVGSVHPIGIIKAPESYEMLETCCKDIFKEINKVSNDGFIEVEGQRIAVELFFGADYKFILLVLGLSGATSNYACAWCKVLKSDRADMSKPEEFYWGEDQRRTIQELIDCSRKQQFSCKHPPLLRIPLDHCVIDELHLLLRVTDILMENNMNLANEQDKRKQFVNEGSSGTGNRTSTMNLYIQAVCSCGVAFNIWEKTNADGSGSGNYQFTSLRGDDKKKVLRSLPQKFNTFVSDADIASQLQVLWTDFQKIYDLLSSPNPTAAEINIFPLVNKWINDFTSLGGVVGGFEKRRVTPYMHILAYHVPMWIKQQKNIKQFTGQAVEKKNDDIRKVHNLKSSHYDSSYEAMAACKRMDLLQDKTRQKHQYTMQPREAKKRKVATVGVMVREDTIQHLNRKHELQLETVSSLRMKIKDLGKKTALKNKDRLIKELMSYENLEL